MTTVHDTLIDLLADDFTQICLELKHACLVRQLKDTAAHRDAICECQASVDAVLDMFLLVRRPTVPDRPGRPSPIVAPARPAALT